MSIRSICVEGTSGSSSPHSPLPHTSANKFPGIVSKALQTSAANFQDRTQNYLFEIYPSLAAMGLPHTIALIIDTSKNPLSFIVSLAGLAKISATYYKYLYQKPPMQPLCWCGMLPDKTPYYFHPRAIAQFVLYAWIKEGSIDKHHYRPLKDQIEVTPRLIKDFLIICTHFKSYDLKEEGFTYLLTEMGKSFTRFTELCEEIFEIQKDTLFDWKEKFQNEQPAVIQLEILEQFIEVFCSHPFFQEDMQFENIICDFFDKAAYDVLSKDSSLLTLEKICKVRLSLNIVSHPYYFPLTISRLFNNLDLFLLLKSRLFAQELSHDTPAANLVRAYFEWKSLRWEAHDFLLRLQQIQEHRECYAQCEVMVCALKALWTSQEEDFIFTTTLKNAKEYTLPDVSNTFLKQGLIDHTFNDPKNNYLIKVFPHLKFLKDPHMVLIKAYFNQNLPPVKFIIPKRALKFIPVFGSLFDGLNLWKESYTHEHCWGNELLPDGSKNTYHPEAVARVLLYALKQAGYIYIEDYKPIKNLSLDVMLDIVRLAHLCDISELKRECINYLENLQLKDEEELIKYVYANYFLDNELLKKCDEQLSEFSAKSTIQQYLRLLIHLKTSKYFSDEQHEKWVKEKCLERLDKEECISDDALEVVCAALLNLDPLLESLFLKNTKALQVCLNTHIVKVESPAANLLQACVMHMHQQDLSEITTHILREPKLYHEYPDMIKIVQGLNAMYQKDWTEAIKYFDIAWKLKTERKSLVHMLKGVCYYEQAAYKQVIEEVSKILVPHTEHAQCLAIRGACHFMLGDKKLAEKDFKETIYMHLYSSMVWTYLGHQALQNNDYGKADRYYSQAIKKNPAYIEAYLYRGYSSLIHSPLLLSDAIDDFSKVISSQANETLAWSLRGECHLHAKNYEQALSDLSQAIQLGAKHYLDFFNRSKCYRALNQNELADLDDQQGTQLRQVQKDLPRMPFDRLPFAYVVRMIP